ncbi:hypothetical protein Avbf_04189 [Armadillidium vulgare]|nr:hypothetical protein Avbf_04189 [Armadillidium vulgare]
MNEKELVSREIFLIQERNFLNLLPHLPNRRHVNPVISGRSGPNTSNSKFAISKNSSKDSGCHREDSRKTQDGFEDEFGDDLTPSDYDTSQIEVTSPNIKQQRKSKAKFSTTFSPKAALYSTRRRKKFGRFI